MKEFELKIVKDGKATVKTWEGYTGETASTSYQDCFPGETVIAWREPRYGLHIGVLPNQIIG